jgi:hypothetical protein
MIDIMNAYFILGGLIILMVLASWVIKYINTQYEIDFQNWKRDYKFDEPMEKHCYDCVFYDKFHNVCEHDLFFGYVSEYTLFDCYNENGKVPLRDRYK